MATLARRDEAVGQSSVGARRQWVLRGTGVVFIVGSLALLIWYAIATDANSRGAAYLLSHMLSVATFTVGVFTSRRGFRRDWLWMLAAMYVWVIGDLAAVFTLDAQGMPTQWVGSLLLAGLACCLMAVGTYRLAGRDGFVRGAAVPLDGGVAIVAVLVAWWLFAGHDMLARGASLTPGMLLGGLIPLGDGLLLAAALALSNSRAANSLSARGLTAFALCGLVGDFGFARLALGHPVLLSVLVPALWMVQFMAGAAAALASGHPPHENRNRMPATSILVSLAALVLPALSVAYGSIAMPDSQRFGTLDLAVVSASTALGVGLVYTRTVLLFREIERRSQAWRLSARTDELTRLPNRRAGDRLLGDAIEAAHQGQTSCLHVAFIDLDHFKRFNDTYGHQRGDSLLSTAGQAWRSQLGDHGTIYRYGGEEFVVLLADVAAEDATRILGELLSVTPHGQTFSAGLASLRPGEDAQAFLGRADSALYEAKSTGRAKTVQAP